MKLNADSPYLVHDHLLTDIARMYSNEYKEPFFVAVGDYVGSDIHSLSGKHRIEVKMETTPIRTGNAAIEYWNTDRDSPSGILATEANIWLHLVLQTEGYIAFEYAIDRLRRLAMEHGDAKPCGSNSLCKIIPLHEFTKQSGRSFPFESRYVDMSVKALAGKDIRL